MGTEQVGRWAVFWGDFRCWITHHPEDGLFSYQNKGHSGSGDGLEMILEVSSAGLTWTHWGPLRNFAIRVLAEVSEFVLPVGTPQGSEKRISMRRMCGTSIGFLSFFLGELDKLRLGKSLQVQTDVFLGI